MEDSTRSASHERPLQNEEKSRAQSFNLCIEDPSRMAAAASRRSLSWSAGDNSHDLEDDAARITDALANYACLTVVEGHCATGIPAVTRKNGLTYKEAVLTVVINCVGAGVVLFPKVMADVGMLVAPLLMIICAGICLECGVMITAGCTMVEEVLGKPVRNYEEFASFSAPFLRPVLLITKNSAFLGFIVAYMQLVVENIVAFFAASLTDEEEKAQRGTVRFYVVLPIFCFLAMVKDLKQLARFATVGIVAAITSCGSIMVGGVILSQSHPAPYCLWPDVGHWCEGSSKGLEVSKVPGIMGKSVAIFLFAFAILGTVPSVRSQLAEPSQMHSVLSTAFMILIAIHCTVMTLGYLGLGLNTSDNVITGFAEEFPRMSNVASSATILCILQCSPIYIYSVVSTIESTGSDAIRTPMTYPNIALRILLVCTLCYVGAKVPYVGEVIGLVSSVFSCCNNIFFPAAFHYCARKKSGTRAANPWWRTFKYTVAVIAGVCVLILGFKGSLETLLRKMHEDELKAHNSSMMDSTFIAMTLE